MKTILSLLMGFAGALPVMLAAASLLYYLHQRRGMRRKLGLMQAFEPQGAPGEAYLRDRVDPTIESYHSKATASSIAFTCLTILQITWSAMIAVVLLITEEPGEPAYTKVFSAALSAAVATVGGVNAACKLRERWLQYLGLRDRLFAERNIFTAGGVYNGLWRSVKGGPRRNFVEACERIIAFEYKNLAERPGDQAGDAGSGALPADLDGPVGDGGTMQG